MSPAQVDTYKIAGGRVVMLERGRLYRVKHGMGYAGTYKYVGPAALQEGDEPELEFRTMVAYNERIIQARFITKITMA